MTRRARGWLYVTLTVILEVVATLALRASDGFTALGPSVLAVAAYAATVVALSRALQTIPMSITYVIWTAAGTAGVVLFSIVLFGDMMSSLAWVGIALVILGVSLINAFPAAQTTREEVDHGAAQEHAQRP